ncbi:MAG: terminase family protein [Roseibium sp.]|uniref:terminase large subunit domain-containing protein n=1 Tax=Roseibium polysiphoniae TaxID=2571221 RepID=UPI00329735C1
MSALPDEGDFRTGRAITQDEWQELRSASLYGLPKGLQALADVDHVDVLLGYQKRLLTSTSLYSVTIVEKSRRTGATWALGAQAVLTAGSKRSANGMDTMYIGYNLDMAREFIDVCGMWAKAFNKIAFAAEEFLFPDGRSEDGADRFIQAFRIKFASGFEIVALTSKPRSLRGRQGFVIVDEAAFHDDLKELLKAALAFLIWGGKVCIISTHDGEDNAFNELIQDVRAGKKKYNIVRFDFDDALKDGLYQRICLRTGNEWSAEGEAAWRADILGQYGDAADEELFCIPSKGSGTFLPSSLIRSRMANDIPVIRLECQDGFVFKPEEDRISFAADWLEENVAPLLAALDKRQRHVFGEDFGRVADLSVIWPFAIGRDLRLDTPFTIELRNVPYEQQKQILFYVLRRLPRFSGGAMDAGGNGAYLAEVTQQEFGEHMIEPVHFSQGWYRDNTPKFKAAFEDGDIRTIPRDDDTLNDLRAFKQLKGVAQVPSDQRTLDTAKKGRKRHGDAGIACLLGHFASERDVPEYDYQSEEDEIANSPFADGAMDGNTGRALW